MSVVKDHEMLNREAGGKLKRVVCRLHRPGKCTHSSTYVSTVSLLVCVFLSFPILYSVSLRHSPRVYGPVKEQWLPANRRHGL